MGDRSGVGDDASAVGDQATQQIPNRCQHGVSQPYPVSALCMGWDSRKGGGGKTRGGGKRTKQHGHRTAAVGWPECLSSLIKKWLG